MATPQFLGVGSNTALDLQSIRPLGDNASDNVSIQTLDAYGRMVDMYIWCNWAGPDSDQEAWSDGSGDIIEGVTFEPGTGLWIQGMDNTQSIQTAGAVGNNDVSIALGNGFTATGNPFPVSVNLQDIIPQGDNTSDNVSIQTLDAYGRMVDMYIWCNWAGPNSDQEAWSDGSGDIIEGVTFSAGQGLWVQGSASGQYLRFPAPEL
jgi:hypothetical protein